MITCAAYDRQPCQERTPEIVICCRLCKHFKSCELRKCNNNPVTCNMHRRLSDGKPTKEAIR